MDLKSELRLSLTGVATATKADVPADFNAFQIAYSKYYSLYGTSQDAYNPSPLTVYTETRNSPGIMTVLVKVNPKAVFPSEVCKWKQEDYNKFMTKVTPWFLIPSGGTVLNFQALPAQIGVMKNIIPCFFKGNANEIALPSKAQYNLHIEQIGLAFNLDLYSYEAIETTKSGKVVYVFPPDMIARLQKIMVDYISINYDDLQQYAASMTYPLSYVNTTKEKLKELLKTNSPYLPSVFYPSQDYPVALQDWEVVVNYVNKYSYNPNPFNGFDFTGYRVTKQETVTNVRSYQAYPSAEVKYVKFVSTIEYYPEMKVGTDMRTQAQSAIAFGTVLANNKTIANRFDFKFFNFLIAVRDHYTKYQSTGFLFSGGDVNMLNAFKSANVQTIFTAQLPMLAVDKFLNKRFSPKPIVNYTGSNQAQVDEDTRHDNLLKFLYITTMGYLKSGQVITTNLQPYFVLDDSQQSVYNRIISNSTPQNGTYVWPLFVRNIVGTDVTAETVPSGKMVLKIINDVLKEADAFLKYYS